MKYDVIRCVDSRLAKTDSPASKEKSLADTVACCDNGKQECFTKKIVFWGKFKWCLNVKQSNGQTKPDVTNEIVSCCKKFGGDVVTNILPVDSQYDKCADF